MIKHTKQKKKKKTLKEKNIKVTLVAKSSIWSTYWDRVAKSWTQLKWLSTHTEILKELPKTMLKLLNQALGKIKEICKIKDKYEKGWKIRKVNQKIIDLNRMTKWKI